MGQCRGPKLGPGSWLCGIWDRDSCGTQHCVSGVPGSQLPQGGWAQRGAGPCCLGDTLRAPAWNPGQPGTSPLAPRTSLDEGRVTKYGMLGAPRAEVNLREDSPPLSPPHSRNLVDTTQGTGGYSWPWEVTLKSPLSCFSDPHLPAACSWPPLRKAPSPGRAPQPAAILGNISSGRVHVGFDLPAPPGRIKARAPPFWWAEPVLGGVLSLWGTFPLPLVRQWGTTWSQGVLP